MKERKVAEVFPPGEYIRDELEARGWTQIEFAEILGRPLTMVNEIITGKRGITPETAKSLGDAFDTSAQVWLNLEAVWQLSRTPDTGGSVARRARLYTKAPIREMIIRKWIERSDNIDVLEKRVCDFFEINNIDEEAVFLPYAARKSTSYETVTPAQKAWLFRARKLAQAISVNDVFSPERLHEAIGHLRTLLPSIERIKYVPNILADAGIRFLIVEGLPNTRIDGACFWLDPKLPVVVLALRFDRIDYFWHTLMHELGHVNNGDGKNHVTLDTDLTESTQAENEKPKSEVEADRFAVDTLVPQDALEDFITRVRPYYSKKKISLFADHVHVHPGIVVGQLHHRKEVGWPSNREMLVKVRDIIAKSALTDGWGLYLPA